MQKPERYYKEQRSGWTFPTEFGVEPNLPESYYHSLTL